MKIKTILSFVSVGLCALLLTSCSDDSSSAPDEPVDTFDASIVCPADGLNAYGEPNRGTFTDARDGRVYKYTTIGNQVWMAENLKFDAPYSVCYDKIEGYCETFGRFYSLHENGEWLDLFDQELLVTVCPAGWHIPSVDEWNVLVYNVGGSEKAFSRLYSSFDFGERYEKGSDDCGFSALPSGSLLQNGEIASEYVITFFWTSTARDFQSSYCSAFGSKGVTFEMNEFKMPIRCVKG